MVTQRDSTPLAGSKNSGEHPTLCKGLDLPAIFLLHTRTHGQALPNLSSNHLASAVAHLDHSLRLHRWQQLHKSRSGMRLLHLLEVRPLAPTRLRHPYILHQHRLPHLNILLSYNTKSLSSLSAYRLCNQNTHPCSRNHNVIVSRVRLLRRRPWLQRRSSMI